MPPGNRPRLLVLLFLIAGPAAVLTCDDARPVVPLADLIAQAFCAHQFTCCSPIELSALTSDRYTTEKDCVTFATLAAREQLGTVNGAIAQGRITVDPARADACVAAYRDQGCNMSFQNVSSVGPLPDVGAVVALCPDLLAGHVPSGQACSISAECLPGSRCVNGGSSTVSIGGTGNTFGGSSGMAGSSGALSGDSGACVPYQQLGEPCNSSADCDQGAHAACQNPGFVCGPPGQEGDPCTAQVDPFTGATVGDDCDPAQRLFCDLFLTGVCRRYPQDGQPCNPIGSVQCDPDPALALSCNPVSGACKKPGNEGAACGAPAIPPCRADLACHPTQSDGIGKCGSLPVAGETCIDRCASPALCFGGRCTMPGTRAIGASCSVYTDCASLQCLSSHCAPPNVSAVCAGAGVTVGNPNGGMGGVGGTAGVGGVSGTGGVGGAAGRPPPSGTAGSTSIDGGPVPLGCPISLPAIGDPLIADFSDPMGALPIGGTFTYAAPSTSPAPVATMEGGAWHVTLDAPGLPDAQFLGAGIFFIGNPPGLGCIDATVHSGVQFDISGTIGGTGCTAQYSTNDSAHTDSTVDPKGAGPVGSWSPQAPFTVTPTTMTVMLPFVGPLAPVGGNPAISVDKSRLTGVQWQFTVAAGVENNCAVDVTIDNVKFF